jgi:hypothetical protein
MDSVFINKALWSTFSDDELALYKQRIFEHYRVNGFPHYHLCQAEMNKKFQSLVKFNHTNVIQGDVIQQTMHGLALAWHYHPHAWDIPCSGMLTPQQVFNDDELFRRAIDKRIKYGSYISDSGMRKALRSYSGTQAVSNFRPTAAAAIYHELLPSAGGTVWDMSCGFGGRLLGALACNRVRTYIGTDPGSQTFQGLQSMASELNHRGMQIELLKLGSEVFLPSSGSLDLCFTSPPYFDTEKYSAETTQSYLKYPQKTSWLNDFMGITLDNCRHGLKPEGLLAINIANVKSYPTLEHDFLQLAENRGWMLIRTLRLALSKMMGTRTRGGDSFKYEPVFIFRKFS